VGNGVLNVLFAGAPAQVPWVHAGRISATMANLVLVGRLWAMNGDGNKYVRLTRAKGAL
jgi:hypothetical protein